DKPSYELFLAEHRRNEEAARNAKMVKEEAARKAKSANILGELKTVPSTDINMALWLYVQLTYLDPTNQEYKKKRDALYKQVAEADSKVAEADSKKVRETEQLANPAAFVTIESFSGSKVAFGNIMEADFT